MFCFEPKTLEGSKLISSKHPNLLIKIQNPDQLKKDIFGVKTDSRTPDVRTEP